MDVSKCVAKVAVKESLRGLWQVTLAGQEHIMDLDLISHAEI